MAIITPPAIRKGQYEVGTEELLHSLAETYRDHPRIEYVQKVLRATTVQTRYFTRPLHELTHPSGTLEQRTARHFEESLRLAEEVAHEAMQTANVSAQDIDCVVTLSATGYTTPGLDVFLCQRLGCPSKTRRLHFTNMGCAGGAYSLIRAAEQVQVRPDAVVLVVCGDLFSHYLHPDDTEMDGMIFKGLLGDAAGACVVRSPQPEDTGPIVAGSWEYLCPGTSDIVGYEPHSDGLHSHNSFRLIQAVASSAPELAKWLQETALVGESAAPDFLVAHPGSPRILGRLLEGLGLPTSMAVHSWESLKEIGNVGAVSMLDVLARTFTSPPPNGARGLFTGVGPGVTVCALTAVWQQNTTASARTGRDT
ncbi:hypothetical protein [Streptomyces sp. NPDC007205]|uniref:hypothetical protein n=1 Tax=Streptomyces sp. NPDC007205 TaxID=3154316 RepID=UPI003411EE24